MVTTLREDHGAVSTPIVAVLDSPDRLLHRRVAAVLGDSAVRFGERADGFDEDPGPVHTVVLIPREAMTRSEASDPSPPAGVPASAWIVAITPAIDRAGASRAVTSGISGIVLEPRLRESLLPTILAVAAGQIALPREASPVGVSPLSYREKQLLALVILGFSNAEMARRLHLAESTVKSHLSSAFRKLGVRSRAQAAALILDPHGGLGTGILAITGEERPGARGSRGAYGS